MMMMNSKEIARERRREECFVFVFNRREIWVMESRWEEQHVGKVSNFKSRIGNL